MPADTIHPATRLYLMGFDTAFLLAKYMPEDPDAFIAEVEEEARKILTQPEGE